MKYKKLENQLYIQKPLNNHTSQSNKNFYTRQNYE